MHLTQSFTRAGLLLLLILGLAGCSQAGDEQEATTSPTTLPPHSPPTAGNPVWWRPSAGPSWQWQLAGKLDPDRQTDVIDIDLDVDRSVVEHLHQKGSKVICYIGVGSYENWRDDADQFPPELLGKDYTGWSGEKWLDIRRLDLLSPIMLARLDRCAEKGFDAVELT